MPPRKGETEAAWRRRLRKDAAARSRDRFGPMTPQERRNVGLDPSPHPAPPGLPASPRQRDDRPAS